MITISARGTYRNPDQPVNRESAAHGTRALYAPRMKKWHVQEPLSTRWARDTKAGMCEEARGIAVDVVLHRKSCDTQRTPQLP
ncbi:hypothetical protein CDD83_4806 [Cordyceps sp. RAO-2017]|nr:hypothetical protein CDD83_4806 [Cordyceps sp. RAO-2017]